MTAIAYRDGVMSADSGTFAGGLYVGAHRKIGRAPDGTIGAATGPTSVCDRFRRWLEGDMLTRFSTPDLERDFLAILVKPDGTVLYLEDDGEPYEVVAPFHALGCAQDVLIGAMAAGATAEEAVLIATSRCDGVGATPQVVYLDPRAWRLPLNFDQLCDAFAAGFRHALSGAILLPDNDPEPPSDTHPVVGNTLDLGPHMDAISLLKAVVGFGSQALVLLTEWRKQNAGLYYHHAFLGDPGSRCGPMVEGNGFQRVIDGVTFTVLVPPAPDAPPGAVASLSWCLGMVPVAAKH